MAELQGQVALVTGGSRGIGLAIARDLAQAGARVAVVARDGARAEAAAGELPGEGHRGYAVDVAAWTSWARGMLSLSLPWIGKCPRRRVPIC